MHIDRVLRTPLSFFYDNPIDRIVSRFVEDIGLLDNVIPASLQCFLGSFAALIQIIFIIGFSTFSFLKFLIFFAIIYYCIRWFSISSNRRVKIFEAFSNFQLLDHLSDTISGILNEFI